MDTFIPPNPIRPNIYVNISPGKGRGVFAAHPLKAGEIIEICPVLVLPPNNRPQIDNTKLYDYYFLWGEDQSEIAIALGYGSLYNHSYQPNAEYEADYDSNTLTFICYKDIDADEEITVNYNCDTDDDTPVWFDK
ncbi:SET domain-containing protein [Sphingobacteriales bacterium UPWRP_1]|nr:SET domain-containing protein-lysine N-methyltransferase [Sphingobacteriales bacterium TSM_CSS]PSJ78736.1 SET domain-containing protein [Sphingobacteriales bacterium UPWRP_1]